MEYANCGDLFTRIVESPKSRLPEDDARPIFAQIAEGLLYLHAMGYVHRDIKPENVLIGKEGRVLIADLGFGAMWNDKTLTNAACGSLFYASPEIIKHDGVYFGPEVDVWSLGATLYAMTCGKLPFSASDDDDIRAMIEEGDFSSFPYFISQQLRNLITEMLNTNPFERIKMSEVVKHPWVTGGDVTQRKVGNPRRHSALPASASAGIYTSGKAAHVFQSEEADGLYKELVVAEEEKVVPKAVEEKTESKAEPPPKTKKKKPKKEKKAKSSDREKEKGKEKGKEKEKEKTGKTAKVSKKDLRDLPVIVEDLSLPAAPPSGAEQRTLEPGEKAKAKWQNMLSARQKKKKRNSLLLS